MTAIPLESIAVWNDDDIRHRLKLAIKTEIEYAGKWAGYVWRIHLVGQDVKSGQQDSLEKALAYLGSAYRIALHDAFLELRDAWDSHIEQMTLLNGQLEGVES